MSTPTDDTPAPAADLRQRAETRLHARIGAIPAMTPQELAQLVHELDVHHIELEMQNDELRGSQQALEQSRDRYADLYDFAPLGYVTLDAQGFIREINLTAATMLERERGALLGTRLAAHVAPEDKNAFAHHLHRCAAVKQVTTELRLVDRQGQMTFVQLHSLLAESPDGNSLYRTAITDISQRKRVEEELQALNRLLEQRVAERTAAAEQRAVQLRALAAELVQTEQRERRRLAQVLHDNLQQLLVSTRMKLSLLRRRLKDEALDQYAGQIDHLLEESIAASRSLTLELSPPVLYEAGLEGGLRWLARQMEAKQGMAVAVEADRAAEPTDEATRLFLFQAVRELLFNVAKHADTQRAQVRMSKTAEQEILIEVCDTGVGMHPERVKTGVGAESGLGLFSIRERLSPLGGRMAIESVPGKGTRIAIVMPLAQRGPPPLGDDALGPHTGLQQAREPGLPKPAAAPGRSDRLRILLADDHPIVRKGLADLLNERPEFELVGQAKDGQEAWQIASRTRPDVVLMDVTMPKLSGVEATRRITAELPGVLVIGLSMHEGADMARAMREAGAVAYFAKGQDPEALVSMILAQATAHSRANDS